MNLLRWPWSRMSGLPEYQIMNENGSDAGSEEHLLAEKSSLRPREGPGGLSGELRRPYLWVHLMVFTFYSALFLTFVLSLQGEEKICADDQTMVWSPARKALKAERSLWMNEVTDGNVYRGKPRPELDAAWDELVLYSNLRLKAEDLKKINRTSVRLSDESGQLTDYYWSGLNVHHQIHCLKLVRQALFPDYYFKGNVKLKRHLEDHIDHCVDNIRMALMCKADISIGSYDWVDNNRRPLTNFRTEHSCYNWDLVNNWARDRHFDIYDNITIVHPFLGKSYPLDSDGKYVFTEEIDPFLGNKITPPLK
ncbi:hypothetical protein CORC01_01080 [Colletotrichum orchidophilum]|uniref:Tat pathway signal sequence n=1 Tax=Colletotrichum orchidophilum TaxID=1209926 RepID=A0A1G4BQP1_9PEZI|nr:uncharacterized protein CORC01_01080 [Colletotrichum orchidophilum]OHF03761.1 hypothetical protein CORC01_01080 [Colletotrichum orchidophilum]